MRNRLSFSQLLRAKRERGAIIVLFLLLLPILLLVLYFSINTGFSGVVLTELQVAADNAALAGSGRLCSNNECYEAALTAAVDVLRSHEVLSGVHGTKTLNLPELDLSDSNTVKRLTTSGLDLTAEHNLRITIERGFWGRWPGANGYVFTSFEDHAPLNPRVGFPDEHPGVPVALVANAVRVQVSRPQTSLLGNTDYSLTASSIATASSVEETCAAPFAIPICAFVTSSGDYYGDNSEEGIDSCMGDRLFTTGTRHEERVAQILSSNFPNSTQWSQTYPVPSFPWTPCSSTFDPANFGSATNTSLHPELVNYLGAASVADLRNLYTRRWLDFGAEGVQRCPELCEPSATVTCGVNSCRPANKLIPYGARPTMCIFESGTPRGINPTTGDVTMLADDVATEWGRTSSGFAGLHKFPQTDTRTTSITRAQDLQPYDHYGVFGLPGSHDPAGLEEEIFNLVNGEVGGGGGGSGSGVPASPEPSASASPEETSSPSGTAGPSPTPPVSSGSRCWNGASLGDPFTILDQGPRNTALDWNNVMWGAISDSSNDGFGSTDLGTIENTFGSFARGGVVRMGTSKGPADSICIGTGRGPMNSPITTAGKSQVAADSYHWCTGINPLNGLCNSRRASFTNFRLTSGTLVRELGTDNTGWSITANVSVPAGADAVPVWRAKVPVIAPLSSDDYYACVGTGAKSSASSRDPLALNFKTTIGNNGSVSTDEQSPAQWIIVGFVDVVITDTDLLTDTPDPQVPYDPNNDGDPESLQSLANWGFLSTPDTRWQCNMVRARVSCERHFIPSTNGSGQRVPQLVK